jgi:hypothetical protein
MYALKTSEPIYIYIYIYRGLGFSGLVRPGNTSLFLKAILALNAPWIYRGPWPILFFIRVSKKEMAIQMESLG